ncbi:MAG: methyltransferase domain-containing protein [Chloroflexi bacterium]|nr:methyltransferase domain-containing protein [Chloroflexota bacterium]
MTDRPGDIAASYDATFAGEGLQDSDSAYAWALQKLAPRPGARLLDVACGEGALLRHALARGLEAHGVDFSEQALRIARKAAPQAHLALANGEHLPFPDAAFEYVTCLGSLEHYLDPWRGAAEIARVLKPGGRAAILLPNAYYLADLLWHVWRTGRGPDHRQVIQRFAAAREWADYLTMMGLAVVTTHRSNPRFPRNRADWRWYRSKPRRLLYLVAAAVTPFNLAHSYLYVCEPAAPRPELNARLPFELQRPEGA